MTLNDLQNPQGIDRVFHLRNQHWILPSENQGFQELPKTVQLWESFPDGRLICIHAWRKTTVMAFKQNQVTKEIEQV